MQSCTLRKLTPAHRAEAPKCSRAVGGPAAVAIGLSDSPTVQEHIHSSRAVGAPTRWAGSISPQVLTKLTVPAGDVELG